MYFKPITLAKRYLKTIYCIFFSVLTMAVDDINQNGTILPNHRIEPVISDGKCKADVVMKNVIDIITNDEFKKSFIGILGKYFS